MPNYYKNRKGGETIFSIEKMNNDCLFQIATLVLVCYRNTGRSIPDDKEISRPGTENEPSTGLGLFLVKEFVEKHGGHIEVVSKEGVDSTFSFMIPLKQE